MASHPGKSGRQVDGKLFQRACGRRRERPIRARALKAAEFCAACRKPVTASGPW